MFTLIAKNEKMHKIFNVYVAHKRQYKPHAVPFIFMINKLNTAK